MKTFRSFLDAASVDAFHRLNLSKHTAPKEPMHDVTSDEKKTGNKKAVKVSSKKLAEGKVKVKLNPEKEIGYTVHDVGPGGKKTLVKSGKTKVKDLKEGNKANKLKKRDWQDPKKRSHEDEKWDPRETLSAARRGRKVAEGWVALAPRGQSVYDKFGDANPNAKWYGRKAPVNKPGDAEPGAEDTYNNSKQGGERNRNARSLKKEETISEISHKLALRAMKKSEKRSDDEWDADYAYDRLSDWKTHSDRALRLRGHMRRKFGNKKIKTDGEDRLGDGGGDGRLGVYSVNTHGKRAGLPPKEQVNRLKSNIKFSLGKHHKPNLPEETQIDELYGKGKLKGIIAARQSKEDQAEKDYNAAERKMMDARSKTGQAEKVKEKLRLRNISKPGDPHYNWAHSKKKLRENEQIDEVSAGLAVRATHHAYVKSDQMKKDAQKEPNMHAYVQAVHKAENKSKQGVRFAQYAAKKMKEETIAENDSDRRRKYAQIKLGRKHKGEEGWNDKYAARAAAIKMGRKLQKKGVVREEQIDELYGKGKLDSIVLAHANAAHKSLRKAREEWRNPTGVLDKAKEHTLDSSKHQIQVNRGRAMRDGKYRGADAKTWKAISRMQKEETISEKAPPGAKYERMVKHIKSGYAKDGLTKKEKGIAFATAWKAKKREETD